eukprot:COSAG02_NODE_11867_length_1638_cov_2.576348_1_plen_160_part_00
MTSKSGGIPIQRLSGQDSRIRIQSSEAHRHTLWWAVHPESRLLSPHRTSSEAWRAGSSDGVSYVFHRCHFVFIWTAQLFASLIRFWVGQTLKHRITCIELQSTEYEFISGLTGLTSEVCDLIITLHEPLDPVKPEFRLLGLHDSLPKSLDQRAYSAAVT